MKHNMQKIILSLLCCLLCLCACKQAPVASGDAPMELSLWHYYGGTTEQTFLYLLERFNQTVGAEHNVTVNAYAYESVPALAKAVDAAASGMDGANPMPDIFAAYADSVIPLQQQGLIANLEEQFTTEELALYYPSFLEEGRIGQANELLVLPIAKSTELLHINQTVFDAFAADTGCSYADLQTWEGLATVAQAYYEWSGGKAFFGTDSMANFMIIATKQLGNDIFVQTEDGVQHQFTPEVAQRIWDVFYVPYLRGYYSADAAYRSDDVASGEIIAYVGSTASSCYFPAQDENGEIACKIVPFPVFEGGRAVAVQQGAGMVVSKSTEEKEAAAALFLKWFTEAENNVGFAVATGYMPVNNGVLNEQIVLEEMARNGLVDAHLPTVQSMCASQQQLETYTLYTSLPFAGSKEAREILETSLLAKIAEDQEQVGIKMASGVKRETALAQFVAQENFAIWYEAITAELEVAIG